MSVTQDSQTTSRASHWGFTVNNPTEEDRLQVRTQHRFLRTVRGQEEIGANGTLHIQGYAHTDQVRLSQLKTWLPRAHFQPLMSKEHVDRMINYVWKEDDTAVANTRFEVKHRADEHAKALTMAETLTAIAEYAFSQAEINKLMEPEIGANGVVIRKPLTMKEILEKEFWHAVNMLLTTNADLVGLLTQPQYMRAWVNTRQVWVNKFVVDSQTSVRVLDDGSISPVSV